MTLSTTSEAILASSCFEGWQTAAQYVRNPDQYTDEVHAKFITKFLADARVPTILCAFCELTQRAVPLPVDYDDCTPEELRELAPTEATFHVANLNKFEKRFELLPGEGLSRVKAAFPSLVKIHFIGEIK